LIEERTDPRGAIGDNRAAEAQASRSTAGGSGAARRGTGLASVRERVRSTVVFEKGVAMAKENVVVVRFTEPSMAYQALSVLKECDAQGRIGLESAAVVERTPQGELRISESADNIGLLDTASGSLIGMLVGVLGGPVGVLVGWGAGALIGSAFDVDHAVARDEALTVLGRAIPPESTAVIAEVEETAIEVIDAEMYLLGGEVTRQSTGEVMGELEAAEEAAEAAAREARRTLREKRNAKFHAGTEERVGKLKEKLHVS
jgi:uncharacterized membrane protein